MIKKAFPLKDIFTIRRSCATLKKKAGKREPILIPARLHARLRSYPSFDDTTALTVINCTKENTLPMKKVSPKKQLRRVEKKGIKPFLFLQTTGGTQ